MNSLNKVKLQSYVDPAHVDLNLKEALQNNDDSPNFKIPNSNEIDAANKKNEDCPETFKKADYEAPQEQKDD